jgi:hypothetical protein
MSEDLFPLALIGCTCAALPGYALENEAPIAVCIDCLHSHLDFHSKCPGPCRCELTAYYLGVVAGFDVVPIERRVARVDGDAIPYDAELEAAAEEEARELVDWLSRQ